MDEQPAPHAPDNTAPAIETELRAWRKTHPKATFAELELAVEERIRELRAHLLDELTDEAETAWARCPECTARMAPRGRQTRQVVLPGDQRVELERTYLVCPACGAGLFPPR